MVTIKDIAEAAEVSTATVSRVINNKGNVSAAKEKIIKQKIKELGYYKNKKKKSSQPGIKDVAQAAEVSTATVSRVINGDAYVSEEVKEKVLDSIKSLGYTPNVNARNLRKKQTNLIGVIIPDILNTVFGRTLRAIEKIADQNNLDLLIFNYASKYSRLENFFNILERRRADGLIFISGEYNKKEEELIKNFDLPLIQIFRDRNHENLTIPNLNINNYQMAYEVVNLLYKNNYRKIAFISGSPLEEHKSSRLLAYEKAMTDLDLEIKEGFVQKGEYDLDSGYQALKRIIENYSVPEAVFAANDEMALGAMRYAQDINLKIPEDIALIGIDNIDISKDSVPELSTVDQPYFEIGKKSVELLLRLIKGQKLEKDEYLFEHQILLRESV
ncbi:LacI family DNA-binding transcriptional regulator [Halanaerobium kushneri]|uniref:Transcriptional regulator, LacI family n=1 Tax=Halanaerobium kushneri TaxID=56779 RepID=A0A1N6WNU3_9FIRM|nr:LacI family DNA-binding transcriptional regulator [Halanaerobium kushneri]SIQ91682.1 transcriptional regulator, LacI family [Halanaerobium kushneri]